MSLRKISRFAGISDNIAFRNYSLQLSKEDVVRGISCAQNDVITRYIEKET